MTTSTTSPSTSTAEPSPAIRRLESALVARGLVDVLDATSLTRALYSTDASLYRIIPQAVARPRSVTQLEIVLDEARRAGIPLTTRGAGTSCAGNAVGPGLVVDTARYLTSIDEIDPNSRSALVEPGVVQAVLSAAGAPHGLKFGPDPSTFTRCTIGGMIGNNACGPRALGYGRSADNVLELDCVTGTGERLHIGGDAQTSDSPTLTALRQLVEENLATIRTEFGRFTRQVSGYSLEHLLPENGFDVARFLAGSEGTLAVITRARVRLVGDPPHRLMIALGYASMADAGDDAATILPFRPTACEGLDRRIVEVVANRFGPGAVPELPAGDGWMLVELSGDDPAEIRARAEQLIAACDTPEAEIVDDSVRADALWKIRADGAGLAGVSLDDPAYPGWEDAAVPPERLGDYLRDFDALLREHGLHGLPYGHFGDGCVHCRIDFPLTTPDGRDRYRTFVVAAAALAAGYGGSMSGEHGDGRARSELLNAMYSTEALDLFAKVKALFDPDDLLNPGVLVRPDKVEDHTRAPQIVGKPITLSEPVFTSDVHRCSGVGKCVASTPMGLGVMCPSYQATRDEKDSTRGRARVLQELVNGGFIQDGWRAPEVHDALDLCLSCKGCRRDCPTGIDMASYKSQVLDHAWAKRLRPRSHYALGWLPRWGRLVTTVPGLASVANLVMGTPGLRSALRFAAGVDQRRSLPRFVGRSATESARGELTARRQAELTGGSAAQHGAVVIWVDSFSDCFDGAGLEPVVDVLRAAGYEPRLLDKPACCGLTWISTGQRAGAARQLTQALDVLYPHIAAGTPVIGLEPSCLAVWRSDAEELLDDPRVSEVAAGISTLAELLTRTPGWQAPDLGDLTIVAQPHCHHASVLGWAADAAVLKATGATVTTIGGCCGLAGNFGVETGHYEVSVAVAEQNLLPAVRAAGSDAIVLADGFSCRTQLEQLAGRRAVTLAQLLAGRYA